MSGFDKHNHRPIGTQQAAKVDDDKKDLATRYVHRWHTRRNLDPAEVLEMLGLDTTPATQPANQGATGPGWTDRQAELMRLLCAGHSIKSAAQQLGISPSSAEDRLRNARRKHGCNTLDELKQRFQTTTGVAA